MALVLADRVKDTTTTTGTGTVTLSGTAPTGFQNFSVIGNGNTTYYTISGGSQWEVGIGTYSSTGPTLARTTVLSSSNSDSLVNFSAGTKDVFVTLPSERTVYSGDTTTLALPAPGTSGNVATSNGSAWVSQAFTATAAYPQNIQSGNYTLALTDAGKHIYSANTGAQTITIPTNASVAFPIGTLITIANMGTTKISLSISGVSIIPNGTTTALSSAQVPSGSTVQLMKTSTNTWNATFGTVAANAYTAQYLVIAGGGSGGGSNGGGGGAGGYLTSSTSLQSGVTYVVTVGAGGSGVTGTTQGVDGNDSSLIGTGVSVTATKGGGGGSQNGTSAGRSGGSGGGGAYQSGTGGTATAGQGSNGGTGSSFAGNGGGGGGAGAVGGNAASLPGAGGNGLASSITGTSVTRAGGGGGGGSDGSGAGGSGGGGAGGFTSSAVSGTANTGGGGGGGRTSIGTSGAGGSGVVILSIPTAEYTGVTTGSPVVTTSGSNTILQFNSSGSYTA